MNKNRIRGLPGRTSERVIAKSRAIKGREGKSGGAAAKAVGLTSGGLRRCGDRRQQGGCKDPGGHPNAGHSFLPKPLGPSPQTPKE